MSIKMNITDKARKIGENGQKKNKEERNVRLKDFIDNTTLHGARYVNERNPVRKLFWIACLIAAFAYCVRQTIDSIQHFRSRPYATIIEIKQEKQQKFPAVSFCNLNRLNTRKYRDHVKSKFPGTSDSEIKADIKCMARRLRRMTEKAFGVNYSRLFPLEKNLTNSTRMNSFYTTDTSKRSHLIQEMLLPKELFSCVYNFKPCNADNFDPIDITPYGRCYTFRARNRITKFTGGSTGLRLVLNVGLNSYLDDGFPLYVGFKVVVHPHDTPPNINEGFYTLSGAYTSCEARRKQFISLPTPYSTACGTMKNWKNEKKDYRRNLCYYECYQREVRKKCNCTTDYTGTDGYPHCLTERQTNCHINVIESIMENRNFSNCQNSCPESCNYTEYQTKLSTSSINLKSLVRDTNELCGSDLKNNETICHEIRNKSENEKYEYFRENIVSFEVYLRDILYEEVKQVPSYQEFALISNIGGNLGLFLGMSLLTLTEIVEFAVITLWNRMCRMGGKKINVTQE